MADVKMPQLGESVTEGTIGKWLKNIGDAVQKYDPLVEVITDKVNAEVPSDFEGVLTEITAEEGETVQVGTVLCRIAEAGESANNAAEDATDDASGAEIEAAAEVSAPPTTGADAPTAHKSSGRFSPAVLKLADEHHVDLSRVQGSGEGGRITRRDVLTYLERTTDGDQNRGAGAQVQPQFEKAPADRDAVALRGSSDADEEVVEASAIRKTIARRMVESKQTAPHAWTMVEADVTSLQRFRDTVKTDFKRKEGVDLTYLPFFIKAVVEGLKQHPMVNASWVDGHIHLKHRIHVSIAVATDDALVVPVIHDADRLSIAGLAHAVNDLAAKARSGRLSMADVQGGTFTVNNTGAFGSILSQPILNAPQAAILSFESVVKRPVVVDDAIAIRSMQNLCLSIDHRLLDGWVAGQFLKTVKERLQAFGVQTVLY